MENIREEIKTKLLQTIKDASGANEVFNAIHNFSELISVLAVERGMEKHGGKA